MKTIAYSSAEALSCGCGNEVIICLPQEITSSGAPYIEGRLYFSDMRTDANSCAYYVYTLSYEEGQLLDPDLILTSCDIHGVLCKGCLTDYIDYKIDITAEAFWVGDAAGTVDAITLVAAGVTAYDPSLMIAFRATGTNTGPVIVNINAIGPVNILSNDGSPLAAGNILDSGIFYLRYHIDGHFVLENPIVPASTGLQLLNDTYLVGRNFTNTAWVDLLKVDVNDDTILNAGAGETLFLSQGGVAKWEFGAAAFGLRPVANGVIGIGDTTHFLSSLYGESLVAKPGGGLYSRNMAGLANLRLMYSDVNDDTIVNANTGQNVIFTIAGVGNWMMTSTDLRPHTLDNILKLGTLTRRIYEAYISSLRLSNNNYVSSRDSGNTAWINLLALNASNNTILNAGAGKSLLFTQNHSTQWSFESVYFNLIPNSHGSQWLGDTTHKLSRVVTHRVNGGDGNLLLDTPAGFNVAMRPGGTSRIEAIAVSPYIDFPNAVTAGAAGALNGYLIVKINGTDRKIALYAI